MVKSQFYISENVIFSEHNVLELSETKETGCDV